MPDANQEQFKCRKCKHREAAKQLRYVKVTVGWVQTQVYAVSPCYMCTKCGDLTVVTNAEIGDLAPLVPDDSAVPAATPPTSDVDLDAAVAAEKKRLKAGDAAKAKRERKAKGAKKTSKKKGGRGRK